MFIEVVERTKRTIPNTTTEVVTYTIQDNEDRRYFIDKYIQPSEQETCFERGSYVEIPVFVKTFRKRNGDWIFVLRSTRKPFTFPRRAVLTILDTLQHAQYTSIRLVRRAYFLFFNIGDIPQSNRTMISVVQRAISEIAIDQFQPQRLKFNNYREFFI